MGQAAEFRESLGLAYQKLVTIYLETGETSGISVDDLMQAYADKVRLDTLLEVKTSFDIQSDSSVFCHGYNCLKQIIEKEQTKN